MKENFYEMYLKYPQGEISWLTHPLRVCKTNGVATTRLIPKIMAAFYIGNENINSFAA